MRILKIQWLYSLILIAVATQTLATSTSTNRMSIIQKSLMETNPKLYYSIKVNYPEIKNVANSEQANVAIKEIITNTIGEFKQNFSGKPDKPIEGLPLTSQSNTLNVVYQQTFATPHVVSFRFAIETFFYGAAHPNTSFVSFNYDLDQGKPIALSDLFGTTNYLEKIAVYSKPILTKKLTAAAQAPTEVDAKGIAPIQENFSVWNLSNKGIIFTFPAYQVAPYVFGVQDVLVPYDVINQDLNPSLKAKIIR